MNNRSMSCMVFFRTPFVATSIIFVIAALADPSGTSVPLLEAMDRPAVVWGLGFARLYPAPGEPSTRI